ncbi:GNAT family N-acetyltransferase [Roseateles sp. DAIF2]|uniref:GNAT family N-acetyltransferase n=1 Tax=Roseateles sp. DAIF2 TaxID=2714952 RepID=UPI0018A2570C|nr:GNAT family N-acetyltransferase [Roseateles sp. DAIF2]QPF75665.1 GNAT family N-acetyltransferase [Roseateles sp. DAIF2]
MTIAIRPLHDGDDLQALTGLLHAAYATLLAQGWNFTAATQSVQTTRERVAAGQAFVAERTGRLVGTVTIAPPKPVDGSYLGDAVPAVYAEPRTALLAQLAVHPDERGQGLAERLMDVAEAWARAQGYAHVALDTAKPAQALQRRYARRGYARVGEVQWEGKTYSSVLMCKPLQETAR